MYNVSEIEMYANWILDDIKTARKNHKKINMKRLVSVLMLIKFNNLLKILFIKFFTLPLQKKSS